MNEKRARELLDNVIRPNGSLYGVGWYLSWNGKDALLDGEFEVEDLEAIAWWMRNKVVS